eukprot:SAG31_NODE_134_length_23213_cov_5.698624_6_plen_81_part_00
MPLTAMPLPFKRHGHQLTCNDVTHCRVFKAEQNLNDMLKKVERGETVELQTPHDTMHLTQGKGMSQHPITRATSKVMGPS